MLQVNQDRTVCLLHSLLSVPVSLYSTAWRLFACHGELTSEGLPPIVYLRVDTFGVWRSVCAVPRVEHVSHLEGATPSVWKVTPCKREVNLSEGGLDLACRRLKFVSPDGSTRLLDTSSNITEAIQIFFPL